MRSAATRMRFGFALIIVFLLLTAVVEFASGALHGGVFSLGGAVLAGLIGARLSREIAAPLDVLDDVLHRAASGDHAVRAPLDGPRVYGAANTVVAECEQAVAVEEARRMVRHLAEKPDETEQGRPVEPATMVARVVERIGVALAVDRVFLRVSVGAPEPLVAQWHREGLEPVPDDLPLLPRDPRSTEPASAPDAHTNLRADPILYGDTPRARAARVLSEEADVRALVSVRVSASHKSCGGLMVMDGAGPRDWTPGELDLLSSVAADLSRMVEKAELLADQRRLARDRQVFVATASHELRTPLASMLGYLELLAVGDFGGLSTDQLNAVEIVERNTTRLHELVLDLLTISGIGPGGNFADRPPVDLGDVVTTVVTASDPIAAESRIELRYQEKRPATVLGDERQLERALTALVQNALVFTPAGGKVTIILDQEPGTALLTVSDTGIGIPEAERGRVLEPFFRGSNAVERGIAGSGLGLSIVAMVAEQHAGAVVLAARPDGGTDATIRLPLSQVTATGKAGAMIGWR